MEISRIRWRPILFSLVAAIWGCDSVSDEKAFIPREAYGVKLDVRFSLENAELASQLGVGSIMGVGSGPDFGALQVYFKPLKSYELFPFSVGRPIKEGGVGVSSPFSVVIVPDVDDRNLFRTIAVHWVAVNDGSGDAKIWVDQVCEALSIDFMQKPIWSSRESGGWFYGCSFHSSNASIRVGDMHGFRNYELSIPENEYKQAVKTAYENLVKKQFESSKPY